MWRLPRFMQQIDYFYMWFKKRYIVAEAATIVIRWFVLSYNSNHCLSYIVFLQQNSYAVWDVFKLMHGSPNFFDANE